MCDAPPNSLKDSNANLKVKTMEEEGIGDTPPSFHGFLPW
jgi:hypothetical protein